MEGYGWSLWALGYKYVIRVDFSPLFRLRSEDGNELQVFPGRVPLSARMFITVIAFIALGIRIDTFEITRRCNIRS